MWWPSFRAVLIDLWRFAWGLEAQGQPEQPTTATPTLPRSFTPQQPNEPPAGTSNGPILQLETNVRYGSDHAVTEAVRAYLQEETTLKLSNKDLTPYEWLAYLYTKTGRPLPWLALALAPLGYWHQALKGLSYVSISLIPKTQSLIEWQDDIQHGHVGYVSKVSPDETITVQELGSELPGVMTERSYAATEWKELRPVFISVS